jgi:hypothetical protein
MQFKWEGKDKKYRVLSYDFDVSSEGGDTALSNCQPGTIDLTIELPAEANPGSEFFAFAAEQHDTSKEKGKGTITVFKGEKTTQESLQEIVFSDAWITSCSLNVRDEDDKFSLDCKIAASIVFFSGTDFLHPRRLEHFNE